jgi:xylulokinase
MASAPLLIGIDAGTSACKAVLVDGDLEVKATSRASYPTSRTLNGSVTQDAFDWLGAVETTLRDLVGACNPADIAAVGLTAPAHNVVLVGANGEPLAPVVLWSDTRSAEVANELQSALGEALRARAFVSLGPSWTLAQLAWLHVTQPALWPRIRWVLPAKDFIRFRMGGRAVTDPSDAAGTAMYDQVAGTWMAEAIDATGLSPDALPPIEAATSLAGAVDAAYASRTGLPVGTPLAVGATDTAAELVALGPSHAGTSLVKIASTGTVVVVSREAHPDPRVLTYPHALASRWYTVAATNTAATAYTWLRDVLLGAPASEPPHLYETLNRVASKADPGAGGVLFLPFLEGERCPLWDPHARAAFLGLSSWHSRGHLCRAVLEGVALSLRSCRDLLADLALEPRLPCLAGGGTASGVWVDILVSMLGEDCTVIEPQGPALGAAILAGMAVGTLAEPPKREPTRTVTPRSGWMATYDSLYETYQRACEPIRSISHELAALSQSVDPSVVCAS